MKGSPPLHLPAIFFSGPSDSSSPKNLKQPLILPIPKFDHFQKSLSLK
jgi:hypothetical protein